MSAGVYFLLQLRKPVKKPQQHRAHCFPLWKKLVDGCWSKVEKEEKAERLSNQHRTACMQPLWERVKLTTSDDSDRWKKNKQTKMWRPRIQKFKINWCNCKKKQMFIGVWWAHWNPALVIYGQFSRTQVPEESRRDVTLIYMDVVLPDRGRWKGGVCLLRLSR